jgi:hypothetical protein
MVRKSPSFFDAAANLRRTQFVPEEVGDNQHAAKNQ